ncbi:MAG: hypothetical protein EXS58_17565 [Candidatus Latescibacteria bacterium]|nr:hypothetical protein [Candidatus Latescibacterota bacterium]
MTAAQTEVKLLPDWPAWLLEVVQQPTTGKLKGPAPAIEGLIPEGGRNNTLASLAGTMRRRGMGEVAILAALREENAAKCSPPLSDGEVQVIAQSVARYAPAKNGKRAEEPDGTPHERPTARRMAEVAPEEVSGCGRDGSPCVT